LPFYLDCRARLAEDGVLCVNLLSRRKDFRHSVKRLEEAFDGHALAFPSCDSGNAIALAAAGTAAATTLGELKAAATRLKRDTGLNLLPTLTRLAQSRHLAGGVLRFCAQPRMTPTQKAHRQGTLYMLLVIAIWGAFLPVGKSALGEVDPYWLTLMRFATAALVFLVLLGLREGRDKISTEGRPVEDADSSAPAAFAGFGVSLFEGLRLTRPEISAMILATGPDPDGAGAVVAHPAPA
jgi:hypothetical protein